MSEDFEPLPLKIVSRLKCLTEEKYNELRDELTRLRECEQQWEPQWDSIADANAAGYNEAKEEFERKENAELTRLRRIESAAREISEARNELAIGDHCDEDTRHFVFKNWKPWDELRAALAGKETK